MKKLLVSVAIVAAVVVASCSTSEKKAEDEGAAIKAKIENCTNPDSLKIYVKQAQSYADKLVKDGKDAAAKAYLDEVAPAIKAKDPSMSGVFSNIKEDADSALAVAKDAVKEAGDSVAAKASDVKDAASKVVSDTKDKVSDAAENVKAKAADAVQAGADKVKNALGK